jgi:hypothetical protein
MSVGVEVLLLWWSCGWFTCPAPPGDLVGLDSVLWWVSRLNSSGCSCVLVFLCSYVLTSEACRWIWLRVCFWKAYMWCSLALPGRQLGSAHLVTHWWCVCVLCYMHTQWLGVEHAHMLCVLLVCMCVPDPLNLAWRGSARQSCDIIHHIHFFSNLPSGFATWLNLCFVLCVCAGIKKVLKMNSRSSWSRNSWWSQCSLGHLNNL